MKISPKRLKKKLVKTLKENDVPYTSVSANADDTLDMIIGLNWSDDGSILLQYRPDHIKNYTESEIQAVLKHEVCHYLSLPTSKLISHTELDSYNVKYVLVFREYLAHKEFKERFGYDTDLQTYHEKLLKYYDTLSAGCKDIIKNSKWEEFGIVFQSIFGMLYTAMYFFVFEDDAFKKWCDENDVSNLYVLFSWIYDDMRYFDEMTIRPEDRDQMIQSVVPLVMSMDYSRLLMNNVLTFHKKILEKRHLFGEFADRWEKRFEDYNVEMH